MIAVEINSCFAVMDQHQQSLSRRSVPDYGHRALMSVSVPWGNNTAVMRHCTESLCVPCGDNAAVMRHCTESLCAPCGDYIEM